MSAGADWISSHSSGTRILFLFLSFVAAPGIGWLIGEQIYGGSEAVQGGATFLLLLVLIGGYKLWGAYVAGEMTRRLFGAFFVAAVRFIFSREKKDAETAMQTLRDSLGNKQEIESMLAQLRARAAVFRRLGILFGIAGGLMVGSLAEHGPGFLPSAALFTLVGAAYGGVLTRLAQAGLLLLPFHDN